MNEAYDVIIVGTGASGLFCALHLPDHLKVLMISKEALDQSNSFLAQGGICVLKNENDFEKFVEDTLKAGHYKNDVKAVETMVASSREIIEELIKFGVNFDKEEGQLLYTKEAAHSTNRILHHKDITGREITGKLLETSLQKGNIELVPYCTMLDLIKEADEVQGIVVYHEHCQKSIYAKKVVLATGGIGGIFNQSTNYRHITGDSVAVALKNDIIVEDLNYIQIHPTTLYSPREGKRFLISEAVRGEGAYILNKQGKRFVDELLPRDIVAHKVNEQMQKDQSDHVYLSVQHLDGEYIKKRFPNIYEACKVEGYDLIKDRIPITPAQHYFMGGIKVDLNAKTSVKHLFAVGETSRTGVHGANRLASNSLLEALVFSKRAALQISQEIKATLKLHKKVVLYKEILEPSMLQKQYKALLLEMIKREDETFYATWCHEKYKCG